MRRIALGIVIAAVIAVAAAGYYVLRRPSTTSGPAAGAEPPLVSQLPPGAPFVIYADIAALRNAEFLAKIAALVPPPAPDADYVQFVRDTGFDYTRDLDRVVVAVIPGAQEATVWSLAEGRFDRQKIQDYALRNGKTEERDGQTVYVVGAGASGNEVTMRFVSASRIELVSRPRESSPAAGDPNGAGALGEHVSRVSGSPLFAVVRTDSVPKNVAIGAIRLDQVAEFLQSVHWISVAAMPEGQNLRVIVEGECGSAIESGKLEMGLEGFRFVGRAMLSDPRTRRQFTPQGAVALDKLIRQIEISHDGPNVRMMAVLTPGLLAGLAAPIPNASPAPNSNPAPRPAPR